jgi:hypothetical protein
MKIFAQTLQDLESAAHNESRGVDSRSVRVDRRDLQELLFHFNRIDDELRQLHHDKQSKMNTTTIQLETLDALSNASFKSPRVHIVRERILQCKSSFDIIRLLTSAFLHVDEDVMRLANEVVNLKNTSPHIPPILLDKNQIFMGIDIAGVGKDVGVYRDIQTQSDTKI